MLCMDRKWSWGRRVWPRSVHVVRLLYWICRPTQMQHLHASLECALDDWLQSLPVPDLAPPIQKKKTQRKRDVRRMLRLGTENKEKNHIQPICTNLRHGTRWGHTDVTTLAFVREQGRRKAPAYNKQTKYVYIQT